MMMMTTEEKDGGRGEENQRGSSGPLHLPFSSTNNFLTTPLCAPTVITTPPTTTMQVWQVSLVWSYAPSCSPS